MEQDLFASDTPFTPPTTEDGRLSWLRLIRSRKVGPSTFHRLIAEHGSAEAALSALPEMARSAGLRGYEPCPESVAQAELTAGRKAGARLVCYGNPDYPLELADLPDAPPVLWVRGQGSCLLRPMVALVGARNASSLGQRMAQRLAADLSAAGFVIVSGLARGIDTAAHGAAVPHGTVAVLAGGVDVIYPPENETLARHIAADGALVSEQPPGTQPQARHFPLRNRIISGLSLGVVVVEAAEASGSLITARDALDQGREVLAVPGHPVDARAAGCNRLIRDGCTLIRHADDVIEALSAPLAAAQALRASLPPAPAPQSNLSRFAEAAARLLPRGPVVPPGPPPRPKADTRSLPHPILSRPGPAPLAEDQLIRDLALPATQVSPELLALELNGQIERQAGGLLALTRS